MKAAANGSEFTLATNGVQTTAETDGAKGIRITIEGAGHDEVKAAFTNARTVTILDDAGEAVDTYTGYVILQYVKDDVEAGNIVVQARQKSVAERLDEQEDEITELQEAVIG